MDPKTKAEFDKLQVLSPFPSNHHYSALHHIICVLNIFRANNATKRVSTAAVSIPNGPL